MSSSHVCAIAYSSHMQCASIAMCESTAHPSCWYVFVLYAWNLIGWLARRWRAVLHAWRRETYLSILCAAKKGHVCMHVRKQNVTGVAYTVSDLLHWAHSLKKCRSSYHESSIRFLFKTKPSDLHVHSMSWWGSSYCVPSASLSSYHELFLVFLFETRHAPFFMLYFLHWFIMFLCYDLFYFFIFSCFWCPLALAAFIMAPKVPPPPPAPPPPVLVQDLIHWEAVHDLEEMHGLPPNVAMLIYQYTRDD